MSQSFLLGTPGRRHWLLRRPVVLGGFLLFLLSIVLSVQRYQQLAISEQERAVLTAYGAAARLVLPLNDWQRVLGQLNQANTDAELLLREYLPQAQAYALPDDSLPHCLQPPCVALHQSLLLEKQKTRIWLPLDLLEQYLREYQHNYRLQIRDSSGRALLHFASAEEPLYETPVPGSDWLVSVYRDPNQTSRQLRHLLFDLAPGLSAALALGLVILLLLQREQLQHQQAQRTLPRSEIRIQRLLDTAQEGIGLIESNGRLVYVNQRLAEWMGEPSEQLLGRHYLELIVFEQRARALQGFLRQQHGQADRQEFKLNSQNDESPVVLIASNPIFEDGGQFSGSLCMLSDISALRRTEAELQKAYAELEERVRLRTVELSAANARLAQLQHELTHIGRLSLAGEMASGLAHEINQPLAAMVTYTQAALRLLRRGQSPPEQLATIMEKVAEQGLRAGQIIHRLRGFLRKQPPQRSALDINQLVREVDELCSREYQVHGMRAELELQDGLPKVLADGIQVQQVVINLIRNALEAMNEVPEAQRRLVVSTHLGSRRWVEVNVRDHGPGMDEVARDRLFTPFFTTKSEGMGMGLPISRTLVEAHGGTLWAELHPEGGMLFRFTLPVAC